MRLFWNLAIGVILALVRERIAVQELHPIVDADSLRLESERISRRVVGDKS
jgi:hypothetical protein